LRHHLIQKNPFFPELLNQPEFLIVPEVGKLIAVFVYTPRESLTWRTALPIVEDLFEVKLTTGLSTIAAAFLIPINGVRRHDPVYFELLRGLFDVFTVNDEAGDAEFQRWMLDALSQAEPRNNLFRLWALERERVAANSAKFSEQKYVEFINQKARPRTTKAALMNEMQQTLINEPALEAVSEFRVTSPKDALAGLAERHFFNFDFGLRPRHRDEPPRVIDFVALDRYGSREKIRYLMTKARLISYALDGGELIYRGDPVKPILMIDGNISGPVHDPYRYVKALVSVGWELEHADPVSLRKITDADF
jgi:hypothetical protein